MDTPRQTRTAEAPLPGELAGSKTTVEFFDGRITLRWREFREESAARLMWLLLALIPFGGLVLLGLGALDAPSAVVGALAVLGLLLVTHVVVGGSTCVTVSAAGVDVEARRPIIGASERRIPPPISVRLWPLLATADRQSGQAPTQWWVAFRGRPTCTIPGEVVLVDKESVDALRAALTQTGIPGVVLDEADLVDDGGSMTCAGCGYDLTGITHPRCPECGRELTEWTMALIRRNMPPGAVMDAEIVDDAAPALPSRPKPGPAASVPVLSGPVRIHAAHQEIMLSWREPQRLLKVVLPALGCVLAVLGLGLADRAELWTLPLLLVAVFLFALPFLKFACIQRRASIGPTGLTLESRGWFHQSQASSPSPALLKVTPMAEGLTQHRWVAVLVGPGQNARCQLKLSDTEHAVLRSAVGYARVPGLIYREPAAGRPLPATDCARCNYNLVGLEHPRCPECGEDVPEASMELLRRICAVRDARGRDLPPESTLTPCPTPPASTS